MLMLAVVDYWHSTVMFCSLQQCRHVSVFRKINEDVDVLILIYALALFSVSVFIEELDYVTIDQSFHNLVVHLCA
jgi:hypothetical protein